MKFAVPRLWREPTDHSSNCYFCMVDPFKSRSGKNAPASPASIAPVPNSSELPVPLPPEIKHPSEEESTESNDVENSEMDCDSTDTIYERNPYFASQGDLNDPIRDPCLKKYNGEVLISRLKKWDELDDIVQVTNQRMRHQLFPSFLCQGREFVLLL